MAKVVNFLKAEAARKEEEQRRYRQYLLEDTHEKSKSFESELLSRQADRRKLAMLFGEWLIIFSIPATIVWFLFKAHQFQTSDIIIIIGASLFGICFSARKLRERKILKQKLGDI